jgi:deoxyadenosine/deoxycytidine kinase
MKIVIDGNIGAGKTTQLNLLEEIGYKVHREPIEKWPLELFYSDPERWGLTFQLIILDTLKPEDGIHERCPRSSKDVFWKGLSKHPEEARVYDWAYGYHGWSPDLYILLDKSPELCMKHIQHRCQDGDSSISMDLLNQLHNDYHEMYDNLECPKFCIDASLSPKQINEKILYILNDVSAPKL